MAENRAPTIAKPASAFLSSGVVLTIVAVVLLLTSAYASMVHPVSQYEAGPSVGLAWTGWVVLVAGLGLLWVGLFRLVEHIDRQAGITYPAPMLRPDAPGQAERTANRY